MARKMFGNEIVKQSNSTKITNVDGTGAKHQVSMYFRSTIKLIAAFY